MHRLELVLGPSCFLLFVLGSFSLVLALLANPDRVGGIPELQLGEQAGILEGLERRGDQRQGVLIFNGDIIQTPIIDARPE